MYRSFTIHCLLLAYCLQALIPAGYMPIKLSRDQGWMQLCPTGLTAKQMAWLHDVGRNSESLTALNSAEQGHSHNNHLHHHHSHHQSKPQAQDSSSDTHKNHQQWDNQCDFGALSLGVDAWLEATYVNAPFFSHSWHFLQLVSSAILAEQRRKQMPRAPPIMFHLSLIN